MFFEYKAIKKDGSIIQEKIEATNEAEVLEFLKKQELIPIFIKEKPVLLKKVALGSIFRKGISLEDKLFLTKYLSLMLKVGTGLLDALEILKRDLKNSAVKEFLSTTKENLKKGRPLYESFAAYPQTFSQTFVALIKAGEISGKLEKSFEILSQNVEREAELKRKLKAALTYPIILIIASIIVIGILLTFAIPRIASIFQGIGQEPPLFTRIVLALSSFLNAYGLYLLLFAISVVIFLWLFYKKTVAGKRFFSSLIIHFPLIKRIVEKLDVQRFTQNFSAMLEAGIPVTQALEVSSQTLSSPRIKVALDEISLKIKSGKTIGEAFLEEKEIFPSVLVSLISIGEKAGHLSQSLSELSDFYAKELDATIKSLMSLVEPVILLMIGGIVALIALGVIVPMYQMVSTITQ